MNSKRLSLFFVLVVFVLISGCASSNTITFDKSKSQETTSDGLVPVENHLAQLAWAKPGIDLDQYTQIIFADANIQYRKVLPVGNKYAPQTDRENFPVSEEAQKKLQKMLGDTFTKELKRSKRFTLVQETGPKALLVEVGLFDVIGLVAGGKADIGLSNLSITCERAKQVKFSDTYRTLGIVLLLNRLKMASFELTDGEIQLDQLLNLTGAIGVIGRSAYEVAAREYFQRAEVKTFDRYLDMIRAAERGELLLAIVNSGTADAFLKERPSLMVRLDPFRVEGLQDSIAMAVGVESDHLLSWLNAYLTVKGLNRR